MFIFLLEVQRETMTFVISTLFQKKSGLCKVKHISNVSVFDCDNAVLETRSSDSLATSKKRDFSLKNEKQKKKGL